MEAASSSSLNPTDFWRIPNALFNMHTSFIWHLSVKFSPHVIAVWSRTGNEWPLFLHGAEIMNHALSCYSWLNFSLARANNHRLPYLLKILIRINLLQQMARVIWGCKAAQEEKDNMLGWSVPLSSCPGVLCAWCFGTNSLEGVGLCCRYGGRQRMRTNHCGASGKTKERSGGKAGFFYLVMMQNIRWAC